MIPIGETKWVIQGLAGLLLIIGAWFHGHANGAASGEARAERLRADLAKERADAAVQSARLAIEVRRREHDVADAVAEVSARYEDDRRNAETSIRDAVLADVRAGRVRLRQSAACAVPAADASASGASVSDGAATGRAEDPVDLARQVADTIAAAAAADAQLAACQAVITAYTTAPAAGAGEP